MQTVLLSATPPHPGDDLRECLTHAGYAVSVHSLGSTPPANFVAVAVVVIDVGERTEVAAAQTGRWRTELGDELIPIVWMLPAVNAGAIAQGLAAGADAVLARPFEAEVLLAQVATGVRARETAARVAVRAAEARLLGEQLHRLFGQIDHAREDARKIQLALLPRQFPEAGGVRFAACHHARNRAGADFYQVGSTGEGKRLLILGDVIGPGPAGGLLGRFVAHTASEAAKHMRDAGAILNCVNRELLRLGLSETPLVALIVGLIDHATGELSLARAGMPAPVLVPATGEPQRVAVPGPFLGITETTYPTHTAQLSVGDRLVLGTDGTRPDGDPGPGDDTRLLVAVTRHRELAGQRFVDAVAAELLVHVRHDDDFTLLSAEFLPN